jgi:cytoskeletal protein CcmA (bactofilin family)
MGLLSSPSPGSPKPQPKEDSMQRKGDPTQLTIIAVGTSITGDLVSEGIVKVEGRIEGTVRATSQVLIAKGGLVSGDIHTREAVVGGDVKGSVHADERVEIQSTASVEGDIITMKIQIAEGGRVIGALKMIEGGSTLLKEVSNKTTK